MRRLGQLDRPNLEDRMPKIKLWHVASFGIIGFIVNLAIIGFVLFMLWKLVTHFTG